MCEGVSTVGTATTGWVVFPLILDVSYFLDCIYNFMEILIEYIMKVFGRCYHKNVALLKFYEWFGIYISQNVFMKEFLPIGKFGLC